MAKSREPGPVVGPQVIFGIDASGVCTLSVGAGLKDLGVQPGELVGRNLLEVYAADPVAVEHLRQALAGECFTVERVFGDRILSVFYQPDVDDDGRVTSVLGVATDVTEQRRVENEVRVSRERARLLADVSAALTREVIDIQALLRVVVRSVTDAVAEVGAVWVRHHDSDRLEPATVWHVDKAARKAWYDWRAELPSPSYVPLADVECLEAPVGLELTDPGSLPGPHGEFLARLTARFDLETGLRVPLRSRGVLVGVIEVARGKQAGAFTEAEIALVTDVAERCALALENAMLLEAQREAREELVKFQALADASPNLIAITSLDGQKVYVNPVVVESGIEVSEEGVWITVAEYTGEQTATEIRRSLATAGHWSGDLSLSLAEGRSVAHVDVFGLHHPDTGVELGTAWIGQDVSELRETEAALRAANADLKQFKALVEASPDFIAIAALDGAVKYVNPPGRRLIGMDPDVDVTRTVLADYLTPEGLDASVDVEQQAVIANGHWEGESTLRNYRGPAIPVAIASFLIPDPETGEPFALATVQRDITERLAAETALRELAEQRQALLTRLVDAQDAERSRIAADVHDDPVQALAAVDLRLGLLRRQLREHAPQLLDALAPLETSVSGATDRLRALLFDLEPPDLQEGLTGALRRAAEEIFDSTTTRWTVVADGGEPDVPDATRAIAYRIAKEALFNTRKHAQARNVAIGIAGRAGGLEVCVADDGVGLGPEPVESTPGHRGLFTMQDRAAVAGGRCEIRNRSTGGTVVTVWLPGPSPAEIVPSH